MLPIATRSPSRSAALAHAVAVDHRAVGGVAVAQEELLPRCSITAWRRETIASGSTRSFDGSRPIVRIVVRESGISRRFEEVGLTISLATGASPRGRSGVKVVSTLTRTPPLRRRLELPAADRGDHDLVHRLARRLDHHHVLTSPVSLTTKRTSTDTRCPDFSRGARPDG